MELNCRTPNWCHGESLAVEGKPPHIWQPELSEVFCVNNKGHLQEKDSQEEKLIFFPLQSLITNSKHDMKTEF